MDRSHRWPRIARETLGIACCGSFPQRSHQLTPGPAILKGHGFEVRYEGNPIPQEDRKEAAKPSVEEIIQRLQGLFKGKPSMLEDWEREHRIEKDRL
jgi:hypothetical protein